jgi:hypothetical protein
MYTLVDEETFHSPGRMCFFEVTVEAEENLSMENINTPEHSYMAAIL